MLRQAALALSLLASVNLPAPASANSGPAIAAARVSDITVDGDLADWPSKIERQELVHFDFEVSDRPTKDDASASFAAGYDEDERAIYIAIEVRDDTVTTQRMTKRLPNGLGTNPDGALLYLDLGHRASFAENMELSFVGRPIAAADNALLPAGLVTQARKVNSDGQGISYEWRIDLPALLQHRNVADAFELKDRVIGFDVLYFDRDSEDDGSIIKWTFGPNDGEDNTRLGDLFVLTDDRPLVRIEGTTNWAGSSARPPRFAHFVSAKDTGFVVRGATHGDGTFHVKVPEGDYTAFASDSRSLLGDAAATDVSVGRQPKTLINSLVGRLPDNELSSLVPALMAENGTRTVGVAWVKNGETAFNQTFGLEADGDPASETTRFRVASISKPVSTMTVLGLEAQGRWDLDAPLSNHWIDPDLEGDLRAQLITSRMVLRHLTGLPNWRGRAPLSFLYEPGELQSYSGEGFEYMRRAIEAATGEDFDTLASRQVFGPAGMTKTSYRWSDDLAGDFAGEFFGTGTQLQHYRGDRVNAAANMLSTPTDLAHFAQWVMSERRANPEVFEQLETANPIELIDPEKPELARHGLGWLIHDVGGFTVLEHSGGQRGIRTHLIVIPEREEALVVLTNGSAGWPIIRAIFNATLNRDGLLDELDEALYGSIKY